MSQDNNETIDYIRTGVPGLDELLGGGILPERSVLIKGSPGSGKTTLGMQILLAGAERFDEPGLLLTFEQYPPQLYDDAMAFGWDLQELDEQNKLKVIFVEPEQMLEESGSQDNRLLATISDWAQQMGARRVLIDSISHLRPFLEETRTARATFLRILLELKGMGLTPLMTSELVEGEGTSDLDAYLADMVLNLRQMHGRIGQAGRRTIEVVKARGQAHLSGVHPLEINSRGIRVFPHSYPVSTKDESTEPTDAMISTGVNGLDPLLGGGYHAGSTVMLAGLSGTYKTTMAGHFLLAADKSEGAGLWVTLEESAEDLMLEMRNRGLDLSQAIEDERLHVIEVNPGREPIEKTLTIVEAYIEARGVTRVVIDSMDELTVAVADPHDRQEAVHWFLKRLRRHGVTTLLTQHLNRVSSSNPLSEIKWAELSDTLIFLSLVEIESRLEKVISVLKHRNGLAEGDLRSIVVGPQGLRISDRFLGLSGVLQGTAFGKRKVQIEQIFQPLYYIRDFIAAATDEKLDAKKRAMVSDKLNEEASHLIEMLGRYFDHDPRPGQKLEAPEKGHKKK